MATFKKGDIVICKKHEICQRYIVDKDGIRYENYIDDNFFNREAVIENTYKEKMEELFKNDLHEEFEDKDEYTIRFLDDGNTLSWVSVNDLVIKIPKNEPINTINKILKHNRPKPNCINCKWYEGSLTYIMGICKRDYDGIRNFKADIVSSDYSCKYHKFACNCISQCYCNEKK